MRGYGSRIRTRQVLRVVRFNCAAVQLHRGSTVLRWSRGAVLRCCGPCYGLTFATVSSYPATSVIGREPGPM